MATLRKIIDAKAVMAKTKRLDLSFNELLSMYTSDELEITPAKLYNILTDTNKKTHDFIRCKLNYNSVNILYDLKINIREYTFENEIIKGIDDLFKG